MLSTIPSYVAQLRWMRGIPVRGKFRHTTLRYDLSPVFRPCQKTEKVGQEVAGHVHRIDDEVPVLDPHVDVHPEDEVLPGDLLEVLLDRDVALQGSDLLVEPRREGMGAGGDDREAALRGQLVDHAPEADHLLPELGRCAAHRAPHLHDRAVELGLDLLDRNPVALEDLLDVGAELSRVGVDDLVLLLDPQGEGRSLHRAISEGTKPGKSLMGTFGWKGKGAVREEARTPE